jgi:peroxiredoxin
MLINAFGVERLGGLLKIPKRVTYMIDKGGVIRLVAHHEFMMGKHLDDVLQTLRSGAGTGS